MRILGDKELDSSSSEHASDVDDISDSELDDSFHQVTTDVTACRWAYCILISYIAIAISLLAMFLIWFFSNTKSDTSSGSGTQ
ncbi:Protein CBG28066 [Caenorhabditis briggsae]|uniref:Uncharacterized protein n=2 Tax=Caenorhabditis briggsae TaxID=6238 RepID=A0AAE9JTX6_CAEBR|nr:Protein CBG28066 [Caenorhabditis briggsae]ULT84760.1 hypothetical protein L3Y34_013438 [Caenorhabditis briggsae]UMM43993.1 hypothetical protein L5515_019278 [Caenorhabditis briggsae]CAR99086.1 Protein CBG28066 [Caenorhabditis briggsae]